MFNGKLIVHPRAPSGASLELTGALRPPPYTDLDLFKSLVAVPSDPSIEIQGLSNAQMKLVRYRVITRLLEDKADVASVEKSRLMDTRSRILEHSMKATCVDDNFTSSTNIIRVDADG